MLVLEPVIVVNPVIAVCHFITGDRTVVFIEKFLRTGGVVI